MTKMAFDIGEKKIGVAISDESNKVALSLGVIWRKTFKEELKEIKRLLLKYKVKEIVVGIPYNLKGETSIQAEKVKKYVDELRKELFVPIREWDERLTTRIANRTLSYFKTPCKRRKEIVDKLAATLILQSYLDSLRDQ